MRDISVVVPVKNEAENIIKLIQEINYALNQINKDFEIICVDDASTDNTLELLESAKKEFLNLRILAHSKNSGQSKSIHSGVKYSNGNLIVILDGDG